MTPALQAPGCPSAQQAGWSAWIPTRSGAGRTTAASARSRRRAAIGASPRRTSSGSSRPAALDVAGLTALYDEAAALLDRLLLEFVDAFTAPAGPTPPAASMAPADA